MFDLYENNDSLKLSKTQKKQEQSIEVIKYRLMKEDVNNLAKEHQVSMKRIQLLQ